MTTENEFMTSVLATFPQSEIGQDNDGQLVIYTNLTVTDGEVVSMPDFVDAADGDIDLLTNVPRTNSELGEQCSACGNELLRDRHEQMVYCINDWYHG
jgi:hypothetical protein